MSAAVLMPSVSAPSPLSKARGAGFFWLMTIVAGMLAMLQLDRLVVPGNAAATAGNVLGNEASVRSGVAADLIAGACYVAAAILVYALLKTVSRSVALVATCFGVLGTAVGALGSVMNLASLASLQQTGVDVELLQSLAYVFLRMRAQVSVVAFLFFGLHCLLLGVLILRSTFLPRILGVLMAFAGVGWLANTFLRLLAPALAHRFGDLLMLPGVLGETSLTLWLLVMGVNVARWNEQARA